VASEVHFCICVVLLNSVLSTRTRTVALLFFFSSLQRGVRVGFAWAFFPPIAAQAAHVMAHLIFIPPIFSNYTHVIFQKQNSSTMQDEEDFRDSASSDQLG
jgi:hypothetical protein